MTEPRVHRPRRFGLALLLGVVALTVIVAASVHAQSGATEREGARPPITVREVYVPEREFERLAATQKDGMVISLSEYRTMVDRALRRRSVDAPPLPVQGACVTRAEYQGRVRPESGAVSFEAELQLHVFDSTPARWVTTPIGPVPGDLASATLDGEPAWIVTSGGIGTLLFRTEGIQRGSESRRLRLEFSISVDATGEFDRFELRTGSFPHRRATVRIPGRVEAKSPSGTPDVERTTDADGQPVTVVSWSTRGEDSVALEWERPTTGAGAPVLVVAQRTEAVVRPGIALVHSILDVRILRTATRQFGIEIDPGAEILELTAAGDDAPSLEWNRGRPERVDVTFPQPIQGSVVLRLLLQSPVTDAATTLRLPRIEDAYAQHGVLDLLDSGFELIERPGAELEEIPTMGRQPTGLSAAIERFRRGGVRSAYRYRDGINSIELAVSDLERTRDWKTSSRLRVGEQDVWWDSLWQLEVRGERLHTVTLPIPEGWELVGLVERPTDVGSVGLRVEPTGDERQLRLVFDRAVTDGIPLRLRAAFRWTQLPEEGDAERSITLGVPTPADVDHAQHVLGVTRIDSWELRGTDLEGWTALRRTESNRLGLTAQLSGTESFIGGFWTESLRPDLRLDFGPRRPRGEAQIVTSLLATERRPNADSDLRLARVRSEIQLAILDRELESLEIELPGVDPDLPVTVSSPDGTELPVREIRRDGARRTIVFDVPWRGTRRFVLEYERTSRPGESEPLPDVLLPERFGGERFWLIASEGSVEVSSSPGPGLAAFDPSRIPIFARGFAEGRVVAAYRRARLGDIGTWSMTVYDRAPVLTRFARELQLRTQIDPDGTARTEASTILAYDRAQGVTVELPAGAELVGVVLDGEPLGRVRPSLGDDTGGGVDASRVRFVVPLPARSFVHLSFVYDQRSRDRAWPRWGTWRESGPRLIDVPIGRVDWELYADEGTTVRIAGGNLVRSEDERGGAGEEADAFWDDVIVRLARGRFPRSCLFAPASRPTPVLPPLSREERAGARPVEDTRVLASERTRASTGPAAPTSRLLAVGTPIAFTKFAGDPELVIHVESREVALGLRRALFILTFLVLLGLTRGRRPVPMLLLAIALGAGSLFLATLSQWPSLAALRAVAEAAVAYGVVVWPIHVVVSVVRMMRDRRALRRALSPVTAAILVCVGLSGSTVEAQAPEVFDPPGVVIGVPDGSWVQLPNSMRVFVPRKEFIQLWRDAYPDEPAPGVEVERRISETSRLVWGPAAYRLELEGGRFRLAGRVTLITTGDGPWTIPIPAAARVLELTLDGAPVSSVTENGRSNIRILDAGPHRLDVAFTGPVVESGARGSASLAFLPGSSTRLIAMLPEDSRLDLPPGDRRGLASFESGRAVFDLGLRSVLDLAWRRPPSEGVVDAREQSVSISILSFVHGALHVGRSERIEFIGQPRDRVEFRVGGDWEITSVAGAIADWTLSDDGSTLTIELPQPTRELQIAVSGIVPLADSGEQPLPTLTLEGGRHETFVALDTGRADSAGGRRFAADALSDFRRASRTEIPDFAPLPTGLASRCFVTFGSGADSILRTERAESQLELAQEGVLWRGWDRASAVIQLRAAKATDSPLRQRFTLPAGWRVVEVTGELVQRWQVSDGTIAIDLDRHWDTTATVDVRVERSLASPDEPLTLPTLGWSDAPEGQGWTSARWLVTADPEIDVEAPTLPEGWRLLAADSVLTELAELTELTDGNLVAGATRRFAASWESRTVTRPAPPGVLTLPVRTRPARVNATVVSAVRLDVDELLVNARVDLEVRFAPRSRIELTLPMGARVSRVDGLHIRRRNIVDSATGIEVRLELESPTRGSIELDLAYRIPRAGGGSVRVTPIRVATDGDPHSVDHFLAVWQPGHGEIEVIASAGLAAVEPSRLPAVPAGIDARRWFGVYRATDTAWHFEWRERVVEVATDLAAVIALAELETILGRDGTVRTRATYTLINRSLQFLEVMLPTGSELWGVTVDGRNVPVGREAGERGETLRVPVARAGEIGLPREVRLTYSEAKLSSRGDALDFVAPRVSAGAPVEVLETVWEVHVPNDRRIEELGERMRVVPRTHKPSQKLRTLLENRDALLRAAREATGPRLRARAREELARLDQALSDQLAELEEASASLPVELEESAANSRARTRELLDAGRAARTEVRAQLGVDPREAATGEELFQDRVRFRRAGGWTDLAREGDVPTGELPLRVPQWHREGLRPLTGSAVAESATVDGAPPGGGAAEGSVTGVDLSLDPTGYRTIAYHRADGDATLEFELSERWSPSTRSALIVALAAAGLLVVISRLRRH